MEDNGLSCFQLASDQLGFGMEAQVCLIFPGNVLFEILIEQVPVIQDTSFRNDPADRPADPEAVNKVIFEIGVQLSLIHI